jgi:hypothetical protein
MNQDIQNNITLYEWVDGILKIEVLLDNETAYLTQDQMASLFGVQRPAVTKHLKNIFEEWELNENMVSSILEHTTVHGAIAGKTQIQQVKYYNLDVIISVGYRVNSKKATQFRIWATTILKEYITKGFAMNDEKMKQVWGGTYRKELLDRIRDIRSSEKVLYRQVLDLYATSIDYNAKSPESIKFFKIVQNKLHYATSKYTAAELIYNRSDAEQAFMGLTTFAGPIPIRSEVTIAKNYLTEDEIFRLNRMVSAFFDLAEIKAKEQTQMTMNDRIQELDKFADNYGKGVLQDAGSISSEQAITKAETEYRIYQAKTLSSVEKEYLESIKSIQRKLEKKIKIKK